VARYLGTFSSMLLVWLCALGAGATSPPAAEPVAIRSAAELALREAAEAPLLASRAQVTRTPNARHVERDVAARLSWLVARRRAPASRTARAARVALGQQARAHATRPRWRPYDAAAPPARSRIAR
jgi:hypothetical protein